MQQEQGVKWCELQPPLQTRSRNAIPDERHKHECLHLRVVVVVAMNVSYSNCVHRPNRHLPSILRASFLALLVLGVMIRPMISQVGALHAAEHVTLVSVDDHGHDHPGDRDQTPDPDHSKGAHGLMHQADTGSSANIWTTCVPSIGTPPASRLPQADLASTRPQLLTSPFRPPIA